MTHFTFNMSIRVYNLCCICRLTEILGLRHFCCNFMSYQHLSESHQRSHITQTKIILLEEIIIQTHDGWHSEKEELSFDYKSADFFSCPAHLWGMVVLGCQSLWLCFIASAAHRCHSYGHESPPDTHTCTRSVQC